ncbi:Inactive ubiquitin carboxyl-terminal hydrolase 50 [Cichlidogyrus casuarinus]|uniref:ubiquitinyl hydrolase 1 n=1 Tax=Cichlidogyrus casuarinus TaxID=1844966 RepID=A0ABD2QQW9_9PLAT
MERRKPDSNPLGVVGFRNLGNTCYLNATLQCLLTIEPFNEWITSLCNQTNQLSLVNGKSMAKSLACLMESIWSDSYDEKYLIDLRQLLGMLCEEYKNRTEQDAQEVMLFIINRLDHEFSGEQNSSFDSNNDLDLNKVRQTFAGLQKTRVLCPNVDCGAKNSLPLPVHKNKSKRFKNIFSFNKSNKNKSAAAMPPDVMKDDSDNSNPDYIFYCLSLTLPNDFYADPESTDAPIPQELAITFIPIENYSFSCNPPENLTVTLNPKDTIHKAYELVNDQIKGRYPSADTVIVQATSWGFGTIFLNSQELASHLFAEPDSDASYFQSVANGASQMQPNLDVPYPKGSILSSSALFALQIPEKIPDLTSFLNGSSANHAPVKPLPG